MWLRFLRYGRLLPQEEIMISDPEGASYLPDRFLVLIEDIRVLQQVEGFYCSPIELTVIHANTTDAAVLIGRIIINTPLRIAAAAVAGDFVVCFSNANAPKWHGYRVEQMEKMGHICKFLWGISGNECRFDKS